MFASSPLVPTALDPVSAQTDIKGSFGGVGDTDTMTFGAATRSSFWMRILDALWLRPRRPAWVS